MKFRFTAMALLMASLTANAETTLNDGVYTKEQAAAGKASYETNCKNCHDATFYRDKLKGWNQAPLAEFYYLVSSTMPASAPGALPLEDYTSALAYILSMLDYPAGDTELNHEDGSMDDILIVTD